MSDWARNATKLVKGAKQAIKDLKWPVRYFGWRASNYVHIDFVRWRYTFSNELIGMANTAMMREAAKLRLSYYDYFDGFHEPVRDGLHPAKGANIEAMERLLLDIADAGCRDGEAGLDWENDHESSALADPHGQDSGEEDEDVVAEEDEDDPLELPDIVGGH